MSIFFKIIHNFHSYQENFFLLKALFGEEEEEHEH